MHEGDSKLGRENRDVEQEEKDWKTMGETELCLLGIINCCWESDEDGAALSDHTDLAHKGFCPKLLTIIGCNYMTYKRRRKLQECSN